MTNIVAFSLKRKRVKIWFFILLVHRFMDPALYNSSSSSMTTSEAKHDLEPVTSGCTQSSWLLQRNLPSIPRTCWIIETETKSQHHNYPPKMLAIEKQRHPVISVPRAWLVVRSIPCGGDFLLMNNPPPPLHAGVGSGFLAVDSWAHVSALRTLLSLSWEVGV